MPDHYRVEMQHIVKTYGKTAALNDVSLKVGVGEIHALVGENGAGKSTLMKILSGAIKKDSGSIKIDDQNVTVRSPNEARELGIGIIYQEFALAPDLTVAENIFLNEISRNKGLINWSNLFKKADEIIKTLGFNINSKVYVRDLSVAYQQVIEIAKAISGELKVLILDEPTAVLAPSETRQLFKLLLKLKADGVSIIYISHRLEEVFEIADSITTLRDGQVTGNVNPNEVGVEDVISLMIGRNLEALFPKREIKIGTEIFRVEGMNNPPKCKNISFSVHKGEVLGIAGLVGSGRTELARAIFGADKKKGGKLFLDGKEIFVKSPKDAVRNGIGLVPENRKAQGLVLPMSIKMNATMSNLNKITKYKGLIKHKEEEELVKELSKILRIKTSSIDLATENLSGGNQQKVVLAKWFNTDCRIIILDEPTRGVDVGAKVEIYHLINQLASKGIGVIVISSELLEIIGLCDRVLVMNNAEIKGSLLKSEMTEKSIMTLAIGGKEHEYST
ncbi:sugar ABC transporter ATP-binding protein [Metabacillus litoralis]|uniref:sugar ABC transporter ATP-binding protein n=1 Tax=Metabacillus TaxID=2675233 RepID=UPI000EF57345|nr:sugar ABC transporter ATP-binding protein [Metabacillus litoralis]MCM3161446.1 sugar ABC transporter ATP-binding protein [Metabacillus litoralis]